MFRKKPKRKRNAPRVNSIAGVGLLMRQIENV